LFHLLVTRHLAAIAEFVTGYNLARPPPPLRLDRRPPREADEFDKVIVAFNGLCTSLQHAYGDLRQVNARLERDISDRREAEENVRQSEQRFRDYAETASDWFWETGPDHVFTYISDKLDAFGLGRAELIGKRRFEAAMDQDAEPQKWRAHLATLDRHEPFRSFEYSRRDSTGRLRRVSVNGRPVFAADGRFLGYRGTATDLSKQHEDEERLPPSNSLNTSRSVTIPSTPPYSSTRNTSCARRSWNTSSRWSMLANSGTKTGGWASSESTALSPPVAAASRNSLVRTTPITLSRPPSHSGRRLNRWRSKSSYAKRGLPL